jgi:hypothetical protein
LHRLRLRPSWRKIKHLASSFGNIANKSSRTTNEYTVYQQISSNDYKSSSLVHTPRVRFATVHLRDSEYIFFQPKPEASVKWSKTGWHWPPRSIHSEFIIGFEVTLRSFLHQHWHPPLTDNGNKHIFIFPYK